MRVLHIVRSLNVGGLESVVAGLVRGMAGFGVESYLGYLVEKGSSSGEAEVEGIWVGRLGERSRWNVVFALRRYLIANKIDLLHTHNPEPHLLGTLSALLAGVPVVHTKHGRNYPDNPRRVWLNRQLARASKKIVAVSDDVARVAVEIEKVPERKVVVVKNGVGGKGQGREMGGVGEFSQNDFGQNDWERGVGAKGILPSGGGRGSRPDGAGLPQGKEDEMGFVVGTVGRLAAEKNYGMLVRAFAEFSEDVEGVELLFVGDGAERVSLEQLVRDCGVEKNVRFVGMQSDVGPYLDMMNVFCLSSITEGTSITLLEAGTHGLPAVVTDVGGNGEIVENDVTGFVVPSEDCGAMASAIRKLYHSSELREDMGRRAKERISKRYSEDEMVKKYKEIYDEILR